jgi:hypothetical protein
MLLERKKRKLKKYVAKEHFERAFTPKKIPRKMY